VNQKMISIIKNNYLIFGFLCLGIVGVLSNQGRPSGDLNATTESKEKSVDTYIPRGFVLVPLEIANSDSLTSLVGNLGGVVDLYLATNSGSKSGLKVGSKLKLLKAPLNPNQFAVLVREDESPKLLSYTGPFIAVVQNPDEQGTRVTSQASKIHIEYQN
jgi:hypothetical protein